MNVPRTEFDVIIIGGGIAGISCALELHDSKVDYLVIDDRNEIGGQLSEIHCTVRNFARFAHNGAELKAELEGLCQRLHINVLTKTRIDRVDFSLKHVVSGTTNFTAKAIFLATGYRVRRLSLPNCTEFESSYIYDCEGNEHLLVGKRVAVVGGGDNALMDALWVAERCPQVLLINRTDRFKARPDVIRDVLANPRIQVFENSEVVGVSGSGSSIQSITIKDTQTDVRSKQDIDCLVIKIGYAPNTELFESQLELRDGHIKVDARGATDVVGIFAGGDIVAPPYPRLARAAGQGVIAAGAIRDFLSEYSMR